MAAAPAAAGQGARLRRPCCAPRSGPLVRPPSRGARQSAAGLSRRSPKPRSTPSPPTCGATWRGWRPSTSSSTSLFDYDAGPGGRRPHRGRRRARSSCGLRGERPAAHHLHRASRQFRVAAGGRRQVRPGRDRAVPAAEQPLHRRLHLLDPQGRHGRPAGLARRRRLRAGAHPGGRRQYRRAGRPEVPQRHPHRRSSAANARPARWCRSWRGSTNATSTRRTRSACLATGSGWCWRRSSSCRATATGAVDVAGVRPDADRRGRALGARATPANGCGSTSAGKSRRRGGAGENPPN